MDAFELLAISRDSHPALVDRLVQLRYIVFVQMLGWTLPMAANGREQDQFDDERALYLLVLSRDTGEIAASARLHPTDGETLLKDVFPHLLSDRVGWGHDVWEGTRMFVHPDLSAQDSRMALGTLVAGIALFGLQHRVSRFVSVSDPFLERVLRRSGAAPRRLGGVVQVEPHVRAVALEMECTAEALSRIAGSLGADVAQLPPLQMAA